MDHYPDGISEVAIKDTFWAKRVLQSMGMVCHMKTTSKLRIPEEAIKETCLLFLHDIVSNVKRYKIPDASILNLNQTLSKYVTVAQTALAKKNSKSVAI